MTQHMKRLIPSLSLAVLLAACATPGRTDTAAMPTPAADPASIRVIAHRGASALRPEHTLEAYALAIADGADAIEPDLVMTRDGKLVARHDNELGLTTDVAQHPEFADRKTRKQKVDGDWLEGWFSEDFTLAELKTLRARERLPQLRSTQWDGQFQVPTLAEIVELAARESQARGRLIGLVPEIKHPSHFAALGLAMEQPLLDALAAHPYTRRAPVLIQSFETANLRALREKLPRGGNIRLLQLLGAPDESPADLAAAGTPTRYADMASTAGLRDIAGYADAIGPHYLMLQLQPREGGGQRSALVEAAAPPACKSSPTPSARKTTSSKRATATPQAPPPATRKARCAKSATTSPPAWMPSSPMTRRWEGVRWMAAEAFGQPGSRQLEGQPLRAGLDVLVEPRRIELPTSSNCGPTQICCSPVQISPASAGGGVRGQRHCGLVFVYRDATIPLRRSPAQAGFGHAGTAVNFTPSAVSTRWTVSKRGCASARNAL